MKIVAGGVEHAVSFTLLDKYELGVAGVMKKLAELGTIEPYERERAVAEFVSACVRRAGGKMTWEDLLLVVTPDEFNALAVAIPALLGVKEEVAGDPNAPGPGTTAK